MNIKFALIIPVFLGLAACQTGTYDLETPTQDITAEVWMGQGAQNDFIRIDGDLMEVELELNKESPKAYVGDTTGKSGFNIKDLNGETIVNFVCTRTKIQDHQDDPDKTVCTRWEVDFSTYDLVPVGTEYRK